MNAQEILTKLTVLISYCGEGKEDKWEFDRWNVSITRDKVSINQEYKTGLGHRKNYYDKKGLKTPKPQYSYLPMACEKKPVAPPIEGVMYSMFMDAYAERENFNAWADEMGYGSDSIKGLHIYQACLEEAKKLRQLFTHEERAVLEEFFQNY